MKRSCRIVRTFLCANLLIYLSLQVLNLNKETLHKLDPQNWVENYADYLFNFTISRIADADTAADLVQDTFLSALKAKNSFQGNSSEKTWLTSIIKRKIIDVYRKKSSSKESLIEDVEEGFSESNFYRAEGPFKGAWKEGQGPNSNSLIPDDTIENKELGKILEKCISLLPDKLSSVFIMKMIDESTSEEICKELDITPSNVWVMMHRARLRLRKCIESNWR